MYTLPLASTAPPKALVVDRLVWAIVGSTAVTAVLLSNSASTQTAGPGLRVEENVVGAESDADRLPIGGGVGYRRVVAGPSRPSLRVTTADELLRSLQTARRGDVVFVEPTADLDLTTHPDIHGGEGIAIPAGVTLASSRGVNGHGGARLRVRAVLGTGEHVRLLRTGGPGVRITGLRLEGPAHREREVTAVVVNHNGFELDNSELSEWAHAGVYIRPLETSAAPVTGAQIHHNSIHHMLRGGYGYGVVLDRGTATIEANLFDWTRHAIAATGRDGTSYDIGYNIFLGSNHLADHSKGLDNYAVDMHGLCDSDPKSSGAASDQAGDWVKIHHNSFYDGDADLGAIHISGIPRYQGWIFGNFFVHTRPEEAISQRLHAPGCEVLPTQARVTAGLRSIVVGHNTFGGDKWGEPAPVDRFLFVDVTGDSLEDAIEFAPDGRVLVSASRDRSEGCDGDATACGFGFEAARVAGVRTVAVEPIRYRSGDFTGQGVANLVSFERDFGFYVHTFGPTLRLQKAARWGGNGADMPDRYRIGDFNGDGRSDVVSVEEFGLFVWRSTGRSFMEPKLWAHTLSRAVDHRRYQIADFTGDGKSDVIHFDRDGGFTVFAALSTGTAFASPVRWGANGADIGAGRYRLVDVTNDSRADVLSFESNCSVYLWRSTGRSFEGPAIWLATDQSSRQPVCS